MRRGGIRGFLFGRKGNGVIRAVYEFCLAKRWAFEFITLDGNGHFSFCLKHH
jgi:hypothetical protein